jgi:hypothetical protein
MIRLQEFMSETRRQLLDPASSKWKGPAYIVLIATTSTGIRGLWKAYQARDIADAIAATVIWFIICPAFTLWLYKRNTN